MEFLIVTVKLLSLCAVVEAIQLDIRLLIQELDASISICESEWMNDCVSVIDWDDKCYLCVQLDVLEYIHDKEYVHADIKASNLLVGYTDPQQVTTHSAPTDLCISVLTYLLAMNTSRCLWKRAVCVQTQRLLFVMARVGSIASYNKPTSFPGRVSYEATEPG